MVTSRHRILIVDDDGNVCYLVKLLLESAADHFEVETETDPGNAVASAKAFRPHLIVLDVNMPGTDGLQLARDIAADPAIGQTRILFLTGTIHGESALQQNGHTHVPKTAGVKILIQEMERVLGR